MEARRTIDDLVGLQEIDLEIRSIESRLHGGAAEVASLREKVGELEARHERVAAELKKAEASVREFDRLAESALVTLKRLEKRSAAVANMQQHFAARSELNAARKNLRKAEDRQLDAMQEVETARATLAVVDAARNAASETRDSRGAEVEEMRLDLESKLEACGSNRKSQAARLGGAALQMYEAARGAGGQRPALTELGADGECLSCFTAIPRLLLAKIVTRDQLATCEACGTVLVPNLRERMSGEAVAARRA